MLIINHITSNPNIMGGKACIRDTRVTVSIVLNLIANGMSKQSILEEYPALISSDIDQCLNYAAYLAEEELYNFQKA